MKQLLLVLLLLNGAFYLWETRLRPQFDALPTTDETVGKLDSIVLITELPPVPEIKVIDPEAPPQPVVRPSAPLTSYTPSPTVKALLHPPPRPATPPNAAETKPASAANVAGSAVHSSNGERNAQRTPPPPSKEGLGATTLPPQPANTATSITPSELKRLPAGAAAPPTAPATKAAETLAQPTATPPATDPRTPAPEPIKAAPATKPALTGEQTATPGKPVETPPQCRRIGPLASETDAQDLRRRLSGSGAVSVEHKSSKTELGYWVLYPPAATLEQARTNKRNLIAKGAKDAAVLVDGDNALSVSLGFFKERAGAEKTQAEARGKGIDVSIKARVEQRDEYWLRLQSKAPAGSDSTWQGWQKEHPGGATRTVPCP